MFVVNVTYMSSYIVYSYTVKCIDTAYTLYSVKLCASWLQARYSRKSEVEKQTVNEALKPVNMALK